MLFKYTAIDKTGHETAGSIDAINEDVAISSLQRRGLVIASISPAEKKSFFGGDISLFERVSNREIVILSRQIATLFESQVSALRVFKLLGAESQNKLLKKALADVVEHRPAQPAGTLGRHEGGDLSGSRARRRVALDVLQSGSAVARQRLQHAGPGVGDSGRLARHRCGLPLRLVGGTGGSINAHSRSVKSLGYRTPLRS